MLCARLVLLGVLAVLAVRLLREQDEQPERARARDEDLAAICGLGVLATYGGVGHAAAGSQPTLALLSDTTHIAAASVWIGGLAVLAGCLLPSRRTDELAVGAAALLPDRDGRGGRAGADRHLPGLAGDRPAAGAVVHQLRASCCWRRSPASWC